MSKGKDNVLPFVRPESPPSEGAMEAWRMMTKNWSDDMKRLITPTFYEHERKTS